MNASKVNEWLGLGANVAVLVGIIFLVFELRSNTESNRIALTTQFSSNWVAINSDVATSRELAGVVQKAVAGAELDDVESIQIVHTNHYVALRSTKRSAKLSFADRASEING